jgi:hypothetical protein
MKTQATLATCAGCVLLLLAGCDRAKLDRLGERTSGLLDRVAVASADVVQVQGKSVSGWDGWATPALARFEGTRKS